MDVAVPVMPERTPAETKVLGDTRTTTVRTVRSPHDDQNAESGSRHTRRHCPGECAPVGLAAITGERHQRKHQRHPQGNPRQEGRLDQTCDRRQEQADSQTDDALDRRTDEQRDG